MQKFDPYDALIPIFHNSTLPKRFMQIGTGLFVHMYGETLLITAAHVIDELHSGDLMVPTNEGFSPIEGYMMHVDILPEMRRGEDMVDIAYFRLTERFVAMLSHHFTPLPHSRTQLIKSAHELTVCSASGYPASKGKKNGAQYSSEIYSFRGVVANAETYKQLDLSPEENIVVHFNKKHAVDPATLRTFPTPGLKGISGGGLFAWPIGEEASNDWSLPKLVGIVHTFKEREGIIIGTIILPLLAAIGLGRMKNFGETKS